MILVCVPAGRGRWAELRISYTGPQLAPITAAGQRFVLAGVTWRVRSIEP